MKCTFRRAPVLIAAVLFVGAFVCLLVFMQCVVVARAASDSVDTGTAAATEVAPLVAGLPSVSVVNLGQPGMVSSVPQPPLELVDRGPCSEPYTLAQANGAFSTCAWPAMAVATEVDWFGPLVELPYPHNEFVEALAGDTLSFRVSRPATSLVVTSTTMGDPTILAPTGVTIPNKLWFGPVSAVRSDEDGFVWTLVPRGRYMYMSGSFTLAVVAVVDGVSRAYSAVIVPGSRWDVWEPGKVCGGESFGQEGPRPWMDRPVHPGGALPVPQEPGDPEPGVHGTSTSAAPVPALPFVAQRSPKPRLTIRKLTRVRNGVSVTLKSNVRGKVRLRAKTGKRSRTITRTLKSHQSKLKMKWTHIPSTRLTVTASLKTANGTASADKTLAAQRRK